MFAPCLTSRLCCALLILSTTATSSLATGFDARIPVVREYLEAMHAFGWSGTVLITQSSRTLLRESYGLADERSRVPITTKTVFDIESVSKQFTAVAVFQLCESGRLSLDTTIGQVLPAVPSDKAEITIEQLLQHRAGLVRDTPPGEQTTRDSVVARILSSKLETRPGTTYSYSDAGYTLLAAVVEQVSNEPFQQYVRTHELNVLHLTHTGFFGTLAPSVPISLFARGYDNVGEVSFPPSLSSEDWSELGAGRMVSTLDDLHRWVEAIASDKLLGARDTIRLFSPHEGYGFGWTVDRTPSGTPIYGEGGDGSGFGAQIWWYPRERLFIAVLTNIRHEADSFPTRIRVDHVIPKILFSESFVHPPALDRNATLSKTFGVYCVPNGKLTIGLVDGVPSVAAYGQGAVNVLDPPADHTEVELRTALDAKALELLDGLRTTNLAEIARGEGGSNDPEGDRAIYLRDLGPLAAGKGAWVGTEILGTSSNAVPQGVRSTVVRLRYAFGTATYELQWQRGQIFRVNNRAPTSPYILPLANTIYGDVVAWDIVKNRGIAILTLRLAQPLWRCGKS
ncbi:MAG TPA: serine hydrolase domain-containing protein [Candidatus Tumulicola sp.]